MSPFVAASADGGEVQGSVVVSIAALGRLVCAASLAALAGALALSGCAADSGRAASSPSAVVLSDPDVYAAAVFSETNAVRLREGFGALAASTCAQDAARLRAAALVGKAELAHAPLTGVITACTPFTTAAENLSRAAASPARVMAAWMDSPGHRSNLLDPALTELGVGCVLDGVEMLCSQVYLGP